MVQANLVRSPFLLDLVEVVIVLSIVESDDGVGLSGIRFRNSSRYGNLWVGCPSFSHSMQGRWTHGGGGAVGSFFFFLPLAVAGRVVSGGVQGMVGVSMGIVIGIPSIWGGRDGRGTISSGCKYQTRIANTILGRVSVAATWKSCTPGGG